MNHPPFLTELAWLPDAKPRGVSSGKSSVAKSVMRITVNDKMCWFKSSPESIYSFYGIKLIYINLPFNILKESSFNSNFMSRPKGY